MMNHRSAGTEYQQIHQQTRKLLKDLRNALSGLPAEVRGQWDDRLVGLEGDSHEPLRLAVAGEYDVGKSTLIKALTGADVDISSDVTTTKVTSYTFDDIVLLDMPGTLSGLDEHDQIAMTAVLDSDLLLFVVTNELFNPVSLAYFKEAIEKFKKAKQTMLVVNQFDRVNLRDRTPEEAIAVMVEALQEMVKPESVYSFRPMFISARDYCDAMQQTEEQLRENLISSSRIDSLKVAIDEFCTEKGLYGRLARPIQIILSVASECIQLYCADKDEKVAFNYLERREQIFLEEYGSWRDKTNNLCESVRQKVRRCADPVIAAVEHKSAPEEIDSLYAEANSQLELIIEKTEHEIKGLIDTSLRSINSRLAKLDDTPVGKRIMSQKLDMPDEADSMSAPGASKPPSKTAVKALAKGMKKAGEKLVADAGKIGKEAAEKLRILIKYKPWGKIKMAEKLTKYLGRAGKVLGPLAIGLEMYMNYREEETSYKAEQERLKYKAAIRGNFISYGDAVYAAVSKSFAVFEEDTLKSELNRVSDERSKLQQKSLNARELSASLVKISDGAQKLLRGMPTKYS